MSSSQTVMIDYVPFPGQSRRTLDTAALWWLSDTAGAVLFAGCLALLLGEWAAHGRAPGILRALLAGLGLTGVRTAGAQGRAGRAGRAEAARITPDLRAQPIRSRGGEEQE